MTATEKLRRLLDERGVEWGNIRNDGSESDYLTEWQFENNQGKAIAIEWAVGSGLSVEIHRYHLTPEQAVAATLEPVTCHITPKFTCSECGHQYPTRNHEHYVTCDGRSAYAPLGYYVLGCKKPNYCPNCGRRVE